MPRHKNPNTPEWEFWQSRITKQMADEIRQYAPELVKLKKIESAENYVITRFALTQLLKTLQKTFPVRPVVNVETSQ